MTLIEFVMQREGCEKLLPDGRFQAYWDAAGKCWTIGYGTTGPEVVEGLVWTKYQCLLALNSRLGVARHQLLVMTPPSIRWPPGAQDALTDFVYNEGSGNYQHSTVRKCVEAEDWDGVKRHLLDWVKAGGKTLAGLVVRRKAESAMIGSAPAV